MVDINGQIQLANGPPDEEHLAAPLEETESISEFEKMQLDEILETPLFSDSEIPEPREEEAQTEASIEIQEAEPHDFNEAPKSFQEDILSFANSDLHSGPLSYTLIIAKIDTSELRIVLRDIFSDPKLGLEVDSLLRAIVNGKVEIKNLNPVKASLLVQSLRRFAFEISWRQYAFSS
jgi:hypothetical protein